MCFDRLLSCRLLLLNVMNYPIPMHSRQIMTAFCQIAVKSPWTRPMPIHRIPARTPYSHREEGSFFQKRIDLFLPGGFFHGTDYCIKDLPILIYEESGGNGGYFGQK